ncbi:tubulin-like doman-containing protein [Leptospira sp. GIMC2001]|uniref:tubulin-like doman-containing protein n=1 Tax=Leptospira sp. GIMC2001 TaxID=1513297 RepID=UPI002349520E|nr:tubulin-like doman-containing protein [Leptospira sp. GIMC2001]WCL48369.1 hypothetical protein O4O04_13775 [Leptospira sp. GIMC2001]
MSTVHKSIKRVLEGDKPAVRKSIILGVGGSGMKGVLSVKKWMESNLPNEAFRYLRFVGIDTTDIETSIEAQGGKYRFPSKQFFQEESRMLYLSSPTPPELSLDFLRKKYQSDPSYDWLPNPDVYDISTRAGQGANQTRPLGRIAFFENQEKIREALIRERDRLDSLPNTPKYFQLLDVKEEDRKEEMISFAIKPGVNKYYFNESFPKGRELIALEPDPAARAILAPHSKNMIQIESFPHDEKGYHFAVNPTRFAGQTFTFKAVHVRRAAQISIFITCSIVGGTGNGMILDIAAMIKDIFKDHWPTPRVYCILVLPSAFKKVVYNKNARANAYAALKEFDYFMSGNSFRAVYPGGREVVVNDQIFDNGMLYLLDIDNMAGNALQGRDQVQDLTGQFISTFVASTIGGAIEERMVNDSTRVSVYFPNEEASKRKACYNSFGISRVIYPVEQMAALGYKITAVKLIENFIKEISPKLLLETMGDLNKGLVRALRLNCLSLFESLYPDYKMDMDVEFKTWYSRLEGQLPKGDVRSIVGMLESIMVDYGPEESEKIKQNYLTRIHTRARLEIDKFKTILTTEIHKYLKDPNRGFFFAETVLGLIVEKLDLYQKKYYQERVALQRYSKEDLVKCLEAIEAGGSSFDKEYARQFIKMQDLNFRQLVFESLLSAGEIFIRDLKAAVFEIRNNEVIQIKEKVLGLHKLLQEEITEGKFELLEKKNPLFFYLINGDEIDQFLQRYFYSRLSVEDMSNDVDFIVMDREDNATQILTTHLIATRGLSMLDKKPAELQDIIKRSYPGLIDRPVAEIREALALELEASDDKLDVSEASRMKIEVESIRTKIFQLIYSRMEGVSFDSIGIKSVLEEKKIPLKRLLERLDNFSRPYISVDSTGLESVEYYRTVSNFPLNTYEEGDDINFVQENDLPARMDHYKKRAESSPNISVENFEAPSVCKPYEMISLGILLGFPVYKIQNLEECVVDYHDLMSERSHPLHCFNSPKLDAKYFPDPMRTLNYLNPARLWDGLIEFKILNLKDGFYQYEDSLAGRLKEMEARESYKQTILDLEKKIIQAGGYEKLNGKSLAMSIQTLAMLAKTKSGQIVFRKEISDIIADIMDGDGTEERAKEKNISKEEYIQKYLKPPKFSSASDLIKFLDTLDSKIKAFLVAEIKTTIQRTKSNTIAGAVVSLPPARIQSIPIPKFKDKMEFYAYFEKQGSLEWQRLLKDEMVTKISAHLGSYDFRMDYDPTLLDRNKITKYLEEMKDKLPDVVTWEVAVENKIIK